MTKQTKRK